MPKPFKIIYKPLNFFSLFPKKNLNPLFFSISPLYFFLTPFYSSSNIYFVFL